MPDAIKNLGLTRLILIAGVTLSVVVFFVFLASRVAKPDMALLYKDLDPGDASSIVQLLEQQDVPYEIRGGGKELYVPRDRVDRTRMSAAELGLPLGGSVGYEIFDKTDSLGATNFVQNVNLLRALEGELSRTIGSLDRVDAARVHLVMPKREVFQRENRQPSASIMIKVRGTLNRERVAAIQNLVAAAVPSLEPGRVAVVDSRGNLLSRGLDDADNPLGSPGALQDIRLGHEQRIKHAVESMLEQTVGRGRVRAEVSVEIDHDRVTTQSETYDPDGQVVRSSQLREENSSTSEGEATDAVTVTTNLPGEDLGPVSSQTKNSDTVTEETVNYEISQKVTTEIREPGVIKRLSVAVLVDGNYQNDAEGNAVYEPRTDEELESLARLVRSAVGFNEDRGDIVEISNLRFVDVDAEFATPEEPFNVMGFGKSDMIRLGETLLLGVIALLVMLLVVRPMLSRIMRAGNLDSADDQLALAGAGGDLNAALTAAGRSGGDAPKALPSPGGGSDLGESTTVVAPRPRTTIDFSHVEGNVKDSSLKKIAEIVDRHPEEAVAILRNWLYQDR
ncbi:MAG: flagellar basal-body MS-ring/collar protein FliF [Minwuia sp.]|uniref:flagellar basal-body MS-ring/collar protein FliF n=1 Tax=Minwuia sp. TaxID=2493630 RepID=UPI003A883F4A